MAKSEQQTLWEKREAFVNADREYKQLCDKVASIHKNIDATKIAGRGALQNIKRFLLYTKATLTPSGERSGS